MESIWKQEVKMKSYAPLREDISTDVLVIGGGMAGVLTAYFLQQKGIHYVLIEAGRIAGGITQNTTAKITVQHGLLYQKLIKSFDEGTARRYAKIHQDAVSMYEAVIQKHQIDCSFEKLPAYLYAVEDKNLLDAEYQAALRSGIDAFLTDEACLPFKIKGALGFKNQAQFHPLKFMRAISGNLHIYEDTKALSIDGNLVTTNGGKIHANKIIMATHFPFLNVPGYYFMRMHQERSYVMALEGLSPLHGMYLGIDGEKYSLRSYRNYILLGGGAHRTGENKGGGKYEALSAAAQAFYPGVKEAYRWSAQDCMTHDGMAYIGKYSAETEHLYVATGFNKWGMSSAMAAAMLLSDWMAGIQPQNNVLSPQRHTIIPSAKGIAQDSVKSTAGLLKNLKIPQKSLDQIACKTADIIRHEGEKIGVYKDANGKVYPVSVRCPHLGCQLSFNPDERSWDCPCHGSRFDYKGRLIGNPAQNNLETGKV